MIYRKLNTAIFSILVVISISVIAQVHDCNDIEIGFSPGNTASKIILKAIKKSKESIFIAAYSFTSKPIALALVEAHKKGVNVRLVVDKKSNTGRYTAVTYLVNHRIPVMLNDKYSIMHNKFMIFDQKSVETGSFNYTQAATLRNAENVVYIKNRIDIAQKYIREFDRLWDEGKHATPSY
ncbi:phospholipase D family protein [Candidatus Pantoea edessiphila]|uniref:phospholipase D n=1 Tax=Candidatus Pantoea edessiphila TaxID=2044610 RepID=A0A2P5SV91_9GAMM|nr:phospholipase D family protein [Candidatus Pantoea edessiphila]PPI86257.1 endonuclease [Candidatus Pantoea edessiphila]